MCHCFDEILPLYQCGFFGIGIAPTLSPCYDHKMEKEVLDKKFCGTL